MANVVNELRTMILKLNLGSDRDNFIIHLGEDDSYALAMYWYQRQYGKDGIIEDDDEALKEYIAKKEYKSLTTFKGIKLDWKFKGTTSVEDIKPPIKPEDFDQEYQYNPKPEGDNTMNFQNAVEAMKIGSKVRRLSWLEGIFLQVAEGDDVRMYRIPSSYTQHWIPKLQDLEANDWWVVV